MELVMALKLLRIRRGMGRTELARILGVTDYAMEQIERGKKPLDAADIERAATGLKVDPTWIKSVMLTPVEFQGLPGEERQAHALNILRLFEVAP